MNRLDITTNDIRHEGGFVESSLQTRVPATIPVMVTDVANSARKMMERIEFREAQNAHALVEMWLESNVGVVSAIRPVAHATERFADMAPSTLFWDCMDGRTQNRRRNGYPIGVGEILRTDGARVNNMGPSNKSYRRRLYRVKMEAEHRRSQALILPFGHFATIGTGCAAHGESYDQALSCVQDHARRVQEAGKGLVVAIPGMVNTDEKSLQFHCPGGILDIGALLDQLGMERCTQAFQQTFLDTPITDPLTAPTVDGMSPSELYSGEEPPVFANPQYTIAMQEYLLRRIVDALSRNGQNGLREVFQDDLVGAVHEKMNSVKDVAPSVRATLFHQALWNPAYVIYQRSVLRRMSDQDRYRHCSHSEIGVGFGDGFRTIGNNDLLIVKEGQEDDRIPLGIAKDVLTHIRQQATSAFPPFVHVNWMVEEEINSWEAFREALMNVRTLLEIAFEVCGQNMCAITSYSYRNEHIFYPVRVIDDDRLTFDPDLRGDTRNFNPHRLHANERDYVAETLVRAKRRARTA